MAENLAKNLLKHASSHCIMVRVDTDHWIAPVESSVPCNGATVAVDCNVNRLSIMDRDRGEEMLKHSHRLGLGRALAHCLGLGYMCQLGPGLHEGAVPSPVHLGHFFHFPFCFGPDLGNFLCFLNFFWICADWAPHLAMHHLMVVHPSTVVIHSCTTLYGSTCTLQMILV